MFLQHNTKIKGMFLIPTGQKATYVWKGIRTHAPTLTASPIVPYIQERLYVYFGRE